MKINGNILRLVGGVSIALLGSAGVATAADFYAGKQIKFIVGAAPGGGYDLLARTVAQHLERVIPGKPTVVVQNMPEASSLAAANFLATTAARDGTVIALLTRSTLLSHITNPDVIKFDFKDFNWIGNLNTETSVAFAWHTKAHRTAKDILEKPLIVGGVTVGDPGVTAQLYNKLVGAKFEIVNGYRGTTEIGLAIERGEVEGIADWSWSSLKSQKGDWLRDRKITLLVQGANHSHPELPDIPNVVSLTTNDLDRAAMEMYMTQKTIARPVVAPPGVPSAQLETLRSALTMLPQDREFQDDVHRRKIEIDIMSADKAREEMRKIVDARPAVVKRLAEVIGPR